MNPGSLVVVGIDVSTAGKLAVVTVNKGVVTG